MRTATLITLILLYSIASGQTKNIRGDIRDRINGKLLSGVSITPDFYGNDTSNNKGRFEIFVPKDYKDTIRFSLPGYFPYYYHIGTPRLLHIYLTPSTTGIDTVYYPVLEKCAEIQGQVFTKKDHYHIENASICTTDSLTIGKTNKRGLFRINIPKKTDTVIITHPDYESYTKRLSKRNKRGRMFLVFLERATNYNYDSVIKINRNAIQVCPFEMFNLGLGIRYTRFFKNKMAVGVHTTVYFNSLLGDNSKENRYDGIKVAPFYRLYFFRNPYKGAFFEPKLIGGYFSSDKIVYSMPDRDYGLNYTDSFWTYGIAAAIGYEWYVGEKADIGFILGVQVFPNGAPKAIEHNGYTYERGSNSIFPIDNWYFAGPGSIIEIKFLIGGIF